MSHHPVRFGIISALHEEQAGLVEQLRGGTTITLGMRDYVSGKLGGHDCVFVLSRIGKVAAAATVATLIERFGVTHILFTGVAGAGDAGISVGDIVIADTLVQHDMDASPLFPRFEVPLLGLQHFASDRHLTDRLDAAAKAFLAADLENVVDAADRAAFRLAQPRIHRGLIASGDEFIDDSLRLERLKADFPELLAVEMEGAAVAQVCFEFGIPFAVIRTISDNANEDSPVDFMRFIERVAARYAFGIVKRFFDGPAAREPATGNRAD
ncbi:MAG TPA: 5'-methylthioadenosine/adenosylhomocysteine nucleosidase [Paucimonas sp.]|nr:5'-methylthioadenosine/adenosylhomocysteine nucleosidase [Paucimonas sp.]